MKKKIWIDITNSPHVLFFEPIIKELSDKFEFIITARDYQQTIALLDEKELPYTLIGKHYGKGKLGKVLGLAQRTLALCRFLRKQRKEIAFSISHGSPYCTLASKLLRIKNIWTLDHDASKSVVRFGKWATRVVIPEAAKEQEYVKLGTKAQNIIKYPGLKEELYLWNFEADKTYLRKLGLKTNKKVIFIRPEASEAVYIKETNFMDDLIGQLSKDYSVILMPRSAEQKEYYDKLLGDKVFIPPKALDGPNAICNSDLLISAGGTMNREAIVLGTPALSLYHEKLLSVDAWLIKEGYMNHNLTPDKVYVAALFKNKQKLYKASRKTLDFFITFMQKFA